MMRRVELPGSDGGCPKKAVVISYVPLLGGEPGRVLSVGDEEFTRRELAALLRVSTRTLDAWRAAGAILDPLSGPGKPRWIAEEVQRWIEVGRPKASAWRSLRRRWFRSG